MSVRDDEQRYVVWGSTADDVRKLSRNRVVVVLSLEVLLVQPPGQPTRELFELAREHVRGAVRTALQHAATENRSAKCRDGILETPEGRYRIEVEVTPIDANLASGMFLVCFQEVSEPLAALRTILAS